VDGESAMTRSASRPAAACQICQTTQHAMLRRAMVVRPAVARLIEREVGHWDEDGWICLDDLEKYQHRYVPSLLEAERGELTGLERGRVSERTRWWPGTRGS